MHNLGWVGKVPRLVPAGDWRPLASPWWSSVFKVLEKSGYLSAQAQPSRTLEGHWSVGEGLRVGVMWSPGPWILLLLNGPALA